MLEKSKQYFPKWSLRVKAAFLMIVPIMMVLFIFSLVDHIAKSAMFEKQIELTSIQMGEILKDSLRHGMLHNDPETLRSTLSATINSNSIMKAWIVDSNGTVKISSISAEEGTQESIQDNGCIQCHKYPPSQRPRVLRDSSIGAGIIRISTPITNSQECWSCHSPKQENLGVLLIDSSTVELDQQLQEDFSNNLWLSALLSLVIGLVTYLSVNMLLVSRIEDLNKVLIGYSRGDFQIRVPMDAKRFDEVDSLGNTFNQMADKLEESKALIEERSRVREVAVIEERERIARELHDGIAQFLGYVTTKVQAASLFIKKGNTKKAEEYLHQVEDETLKQSIDVRSSILGLKIFTGKKQNLADDLREDVKLSNRFMNLEILPMIDERLENLILEPEVELQLLRITREAVSNVRKHSLATHASISLERIGEKSIRLMIADDGIGFTVDDFSEKGQPHFGLSTMRERAQAIGADFEIKSAPGMGTSISITLHLPEKKG